MKAQEALEFITRHLVDHPEDVEITSTDGGGEVTLEVRCHPDDVGKVIGRRGRTAKALRQVIDAAGSLEDLDIHVEIVD